MATTSRQPRLATVPELGEFHDDAFRRGELLNGPSADAAVVRHLPLPRPVVATDSSGERCPRAEVLRRNAVYRRSLAAADLAAAAVALLLCTTVLGDDGLTLLGLLALPLVVVAGQLQGLYDRDELLIKKTTLDEAPRLFQLATLYTLLVLTLQSQFIVGELGAMQVVVLWGALFLFAMATRYASRAFARRVTTTERLLFVGSDSSFRRLQAKLSPDNVSAQIVARMRLGDAKPLAGNEPAGGTLHELITDLRVHRVIIEPSDASAETTLEFVREAKATGARVSLLPRILEVVGSSIEIDDIDGLTLLGVRRFGLSRSSAAVKRTFDLVGAGLGLVAAAPFAAVIALAIKLDGRGPLLYRQTRIGRDGQPFGIFKFRTMVPNADALKDDLRGLNEAHGGLFKIAEDPRVTRVGRHLRRFSLDELPQLLNVLRGEMSLVGPRPLVVDEDVRITGLDRRRLHLTPGITGHWQIMGSARVPLPEMIKLDYLYVGGWSLWSDVKILLRTVPYVVTRRGM
jgi:exopolysaccharide biosynthesis polyprenyl glycosylphosphotransferase